MNNHSIILHGDKWQIDDFAESLQWALEHTWTFTEWKNSPALVHRKGGRVSFYHGQKFDPEKIDLVQDGWTHDHCVFCYWTLFEGSNDEENKGFTNSTGAWICSECHAQLLKPAQAEQEAQ